MAMRYASKNILITGTVGVLFPHGLGVTPDEYMLVRHGPSNANLVLGSNPDSVNIYVSAGAGSGTRQDGGTVSVFAYVNHVSVK